MTGLASMSKKGSGVLGGSGVPKSPGVTGSDDVRVASGKSRVQAARIVSEMNTRIAVVNTLLTTLKAFMIFILYQLVSHAKAWYDHPDSFQSAFIGVGNYAHPHHF
jgi:hypothetical protein